MEVNSVSLIRRGISEVKRNWFDLKTESQKSISVSRVSVTLTAPNHDEAF